MPNHCPTLLYAALLLVGCSDTKAPDPTPAKERPELPVRIIPPATTAPGVLLDQTLADDQDGWWVLAAAPGRFDFAPVGESAFAEVADGSLEVAQGAVTLVRFVELPIGDQHEVSAVLEAPDGTHANAPCRQMHFAVLQSIHGDEDLARMIDRRTVEQDGTQVPLLQALSIFQQREFKRPRSRWETNRSPDGYATARHRVLAAPERKAYAVFLPAIEQRLRLRSFSIRTVKKFRTATAAPRATDGTVPVKLSRDIRPSIWIEPNGSFSIPVTVPRSAARLTAAVGQDPDAAFRESVSYEIRLVTGSGQEIASTSGSLTRARGGSRFASADIALEELSDPEGATAGGVSARFEIKVQGTSGLFLAQPMLRASTEDRTPPRPTKIHSQDPNRPLNLLFVSLDTLRADHLGSYGYHRDTSPFLDRHAAGSARFENYFAVAPYTLPTHASMFTGRFPQRHGAVAETDRLVTEAMPYLPMILADHGYSTGAFTGGGFLSEVFGFPDGFDRFGTIDPIKPDRAAKDPEPKYGVGLDEAEEWIQSHGAAPWFTFLHSFMIHDYEPPESDFEPFDTQPVVTEGLDHHDFLRRRSWEKQSSIPGDIEHCVNLYDATIRTTDRELSDFFGRLDAAGKLDNTIVVVTADHGEEFWEHGSLRHSVTLYDEMLHVPLWISVPGQSGRVIREPASQVDLLPTLLDLLGIEPADGVDGHSLASHILGETPKGHRTPIYASVDNHLATRAALRVGDHKFIDNRTHDSQVGTPSSHELYDMREDPGERESLAESRSAIAARLRSQVAALEMVLREGSVEGASAAMTPEVRQHLIELGYLGG